MKIMTLEIKIWVSKLQLRKVKKIVNGCFLLAPIKYVMLMHTEVLKLADYIVQRYFLPFKSYFPTLRNFLILEAFY